METLLELSVPGATVTIRRDGDGALTFTPFYGQTATPGPLAEAVHLIWLDPLVVGGVLPAGMTGVVARDAAWRTVIARDGVWLAAADGPLDGDAGVAGGLGFHDAEHRLHPIPGAEELDRERPRPFPAEGEDEDLPPITPEGRAFAAALAGALAADVAEHGPPGPLVRVVVRWFWEGDPLYLTLHVLAEGDEQPPAEDAWYPLEWANAEREFARTDRVLGRSGVVAAANALSATFAIDEELGVPADGEAHLPAVEHAVDLLPDAFRAHGLALGDGFAISSAHFEGWGVPGDPG